MPRAMQKRRLMPRDRITSRTQHVAFVSAQTPKGSSDKYHTPVERTALFQPGCPCSPLPGVGVVEVAQVTFIVLTFWPR